MRILVNCSPLRPPLTGIGHYTRELLIRLVDDPAVSALEGFYYHRWLDRDAIRALLGSHQDSAPPPRRSFAQRLAALPGGRGLYRILLRTLHRRALRERAAWIYWETNYLPLPFSGRTVVTVYDLSHLRYPQFHPRSRVEQFDAALPKALSGASAVLTISEFSAGEIVRYYAVSPSKIAIVPPGVSGVFHPRGADRNAAFRLRAGLPERYLLSVATIEPRKNFVSLCRAYASLPESLRRAYPLVLAGTRGWLTEEIDAILSPLESAGEAIRLGYVDADDLPLLYAASSGLCYVSLYEGYGMPIAEAIASGIPVLTSECTSMPEAGGNRAWYADPHSVDSIARTLEAMLLSHDPLHPPASSDRPAPCVHSWDAAAAALRNLFFSL